MARSSLDAILEKEMRGERITEEELTPEAVQLLVKCREDPKEVVELFKRGETLADYLGLPTEEREKIRNTLLKRKGVNHSHDAPLVIRINRENKAYEAAQTYINWINSGKAKKWLTENLPKNRSNLKDSIGLGNFLFNWNSEQERPLKRTKGETETGKRHYQTLFQICKRAPNFYKLLDEETAREVSEAEEQTEDIVEEYWNEEAKTAATKYINWINSGKAKKWMTENPSKNRTHLKDSIGLRNFLNFWNSKQENPLKRAKGETGKRAYKTLFKNKCDSKIPNFYRRLGETPLQEKTRQAEEQAKIIIKEYWKEEAKTAATTYINWINSGKAENWIKNKPPKMRNNLEERIGLKNYLDYWNSKEERPLAQKEKGKRNWASVYLHCHNKVPEFYKLLDEETARELEKAEGRVPRLVRAYWREEYTQLIQKRFPCNIPSIGKAKEHANREKIPYYLALFQYYIFEPGEKEHLIEELLSYADEPVDRKHIDHKQGLETAARNEDDARKIKYKILTQENKKPSQMLAYLEHTNALKMIVGNMQKYDRLLQKLYPDYDQKTQGLTVDTQEKSITETSLNPTFRVDLITKPKKDKYGIDEHVNSVFLKLFNDDDRWMREYEVTCALERAGLLEVTCAPERAGLPAVPKYPRTITLKEDYFATLKHAAAPSDSKFHSAATLIATDTMAEKKNQPYHCALATDFIDGKTLRELVQAKWGELEEEASGKRKLRKELANTKYRFLTEQLKNVNSKLKQIHGLKQLNGVDLKERDYEEYFNDRLQARGKLSYGKDTLTTPHILSNSKNAYLEGIEQIKKAYKDAGIGTELNKYRSKHGRVVHGDLHLNNILATDISHDGKPGKLRIIDLELADIGLPQEDLTTILAEEFFCAKDEESEKTTAARTNAEKEFITDYLKNIPESEHREYLAITGLFGITRETTVFADKAMLYREATKPETRRKLKSDIQRHYQALKKFEDMTTTYLPESEHSTALKDRIREYLTKVTQLSGEVHEFDEILDQKTARNLEKAEGKVPRLVDAYMRNNSEAV